MKAADPTIKVGVVVIDGETSYSNGYTNHPAYNPRTEQTNYGWTPVLLTTLSSLGVTPDFAIFHYYPQDSTAGSTACADSDPLVLQSAFGSSWASRASALRQQISDYMGGVGTNIELVVKEKNSDAGTQGRQSTSLVNALYYADSLSQLMLTEFNSLVWWDLRNGSDTSGSFDPTLYGWRPNGDLGMISGLTNRYPKFYAAKLMQYFARPSDTVVNATSDYPPLADYAVKRTNGALMLLVINKDVSATSNAQIALNGFAPSAGAALYLYYGIPQDTASEFGVGSPDIATNYFSPTGTNFNCNFPALSLTLFSFAPASPNLVVLPPSPQSGSQLVLQLQGQSGVYMLQSSTNLSASVWTPVSTNVLAGGSIYLTNMLTAGTAQQFWRVVWQP